MFNASATSAYLGYRPDLPDVRAPRHLFSDVFTNTLGAIPEQNANRDAALVGAAMDLGMQSAARMKELAFVDAANRRQQRMRFAMDLLGGFGKTTSGGGQDALASLLRLDPYGAVARAGNFEASQRGRVGTASSGTRNAVTQALQGFG